MKYYLYQLLLFGIYGFFSAFLRDINNFNIWAILNAILIVMFDNIYYWLRIKETQYDKNKRFW